MVGETAHSRRVQRASWLYRELDLVEELRSEAEQALEQESRKHKGCAVLRTVPGIGPMRSAQIVGHVASPHRFRTKRQFWSYSGLSVTYRSSSEHVVEPTGIRRKTQLYSTGLGKEYNRTPKTVFKSAAVEAIRPGMKPWYESRVESGMRPEMAQLSVARKLAAICLALGKKGERYDENIALKRTS